MAPGQIPRPRDAVVQQTWPSQVVPIFTSWFSLIKHVQFVWFLTFFSHPLRLSHFYDPCRIYIPIKSYETGWWQIPPSSPWPRHESMAIGGMCHAAANLLGPEDVFVNTMPLSFKLGIVLSMVIKKMAIYWWFTGDFMGISWEIHGNFRWLLAKDVTWCDHPLICSIANSYEKKVLLSSVIYLFLPRWCSMTMIHFQKVL